MRWFLAMVVCMAAAIGVSTAAIRAGSPTDTAPVPLSRAAPVTQPPTKAAATSPRVNCKITKCIALTFDDGPSMYTERLLDILEAQRVKATFFVVGYNAAARPRILRHIHRAGHEIGTHTQNHLSLTRLSSAGIRRELLGPIRHIKAAGAEVRLFRPPYGATNSRVRRIARGLGLTQVLWTVDPQDWLHRNSATVTRRILSATRRNSIILSHDIHRTTVAAMPKIIRTLKARGYTFVTVSDLLDR
ncbi:polysaccharide deacetylase family protein [Streptosporangium sp. NPDC020072]|uniref:polysaccharide deacetylase family protein n=1 Tax=Streptosporangium sp. NPDC020072 TaxID=3154788 RepID=UPI00344082E1